MKPRIVAAALIAALGFSLTAHREPAGADNACPDQVVVGAALPLTGEESRVGGYFKLAYELVVAEYNKNGGILLPACHGKRPIKLITYDDKTDPATSRNLYERLAVEDHVDAMLGGYSTDLIEAQTVVPQQHQIPYVNGGGAATNIYKRGFTTIFGLLTSIQNLAFSEADFIEAMQAAGKLPKPLKVAIVAENTSHGRDFSDGLQQRAQQKPGNYKIVLNEAFDLHGKDFSPLLQKVKAANADAFMADAHLDDYITMQRQYKQAGLQHKYVTYGARGPEVAARKALGDGVDYIIAASWWNQGIPNEAVKSFDAKWAAAYPGQSPEWFSALPYETARTLFIAMTAAGSVDKAKVVDALRKVDIRDTVLPGGHIRFGADGQIVTPFVVTQNLPDGRTVIVWPKAEKTGDAVLPIPTH